MENYILAAVIAAIVILAAFYIVRAKRKGQKCIGCSCNCSSSKDGTQCNGCSGCQTK